MPQILLDGRIIDPMTLPTSVLEKAEQLLLDVIETHDVDMAFLVVESTLKDLQTVLRERRAIA